MARSQPISLVTIVPVSTVILCMPMKKLLTAITTLKNDPGVFFYFCLSFLYNIKITHLNTLATSDLISELQKGKSLIRVGDGEAMLLMGRSIHYQIFDPKLRASLHEIISSYNNNSPYILAIPTFAIIESAAALKARGRLRIWRLFRALFVSKFDTTQAYADAVIFYHRDNFSKTVEPLLLTHHVIVVSKQENNTPELQAYMNRDCASWQFVTVSAQNAYSEYEYVQQNIDLAISKRSAREVLILFAAGPASKALALHYIKDDIQCIDIGHGLEILGCNNDYSDRL